MTNFILSHQIKDLDLPALKHLVSDWASWEPDSSQRASLEDKLFRLSPETRHLVAGLLFHLYAEPEKLPDYCCFGPDTSRNEEPDQDIIQQALPLYHRMVQVKVASTAPKEEKQAHKVG